MENRPSLIVVLILLCLIIIQWSITFYPVVLTWDVFGYYLYLPAKFIYNDLGLHNKNWLFEIIDKYNTGFFYQAYPSASGGWVLKYSMGLSYFYAPFFFLAYIISYLFGYTNDGFSLPYQYCLSLGMLVYTFLGLIYLRKILLYYFEEITVCVLIVLIVLGTNFFHLTADVGLMPHNILFMLIAMFVWFSIKWSEEYRLLYAIFLGILLGLIVLSRPNEVTCLLFLVFFGVKNRIDLKNRFSFFIKNYWQIGFSILAFIVVVTPQLIYWKSTSGSLIYYSYQDSCEGFDFESPYTFSFLFSFRKGWIIYTPLTLFMIYGLILLYKKKREIFLSVFIYFLISLYIISSWSCWWYAGTCYSQRAVLSLYIVMAIPLGLVIDSIRNSKMFIKILMGLILILIVLLNLFQNWQFNNNILDHQRNTAKYYFEVFGKTKVVDKDKAFLSPQRVINEDTINVNKLNLLKVSYGFDEFRKSKQFNKNYFVSGNNNFGKSYYLIDSKNEFSPDFVFSYKDIINDYDWIMASVLLFFPDTVYDKSPSLVITTLHQGENCKYYSATIPSDSLIRNKWIRLSKLYRTPEARNRNDEVHIYLWNPRKAHFLIGDFKIDIYK